MTKSNDTIDKDWRAIQTAEVEQEVVRRGIEALHVAGKIAAMMSGNDEKSINKEVSKKLTEFIGYLKPIT